MAFNKYTAALPATQIDSEAWRKAASFVCPKCEVTFDSKDSLDKHSTSCNS